MPQKTGITILSFVPLQRKTAVSLTNQGCKGCQSEALCHKARHRGSRDALAHKNSLLTKRREPKPTNSACAEFANQNAGFITGKLSSEFGFAEFWSFLPLQRETQCLWQNLVAKAAKARLSLLFDYFAKSRVCLALLNQKKKTDTAARKPEQLKQNSVNSVILRQSYKNIQFKGIGRARYSQEISCFFGNHRGIFCCPVKK